MRSSRSPRSAPVSRRAGLVLLEVVLALALFVLASAIVGAGLNSSVQSFERLRIEAGATDRLASLIAELELGTVPLATADVAPIAEGDEWGRGITVERWDVGGDGTAAVDLVRVEATVRHIPTGREWRLARVLRRSGLELPPPPPADETSLARVRELFGSPDDAASGGSDEGASSGDASGGDEGRGAP